MNSDTLGPSEWMTMIRQFNELLTKIVRFKRRFDSVRAKRSSKDFYKWKYILEELRSKIWTLLEELRLIALDPTDQEVRRLLISDKKKMLCAHYGVPFDYGRFPATMVESVNGSQLLEPSIFDREMDEYHAMLDYFVRLSKQFYEERRMVTVNPSSDLFGGMDVDEESAMTGLSYPLVQALALSPRGYLSWGTPSSHGPPRSGRH